MMASNLKKYLIGINRDGNFSYREYFLLNIAGAIQSAEEDYKYTNEEVIIKDDNHKTLKVIKRG
jgi:hypothetical protein